jgi:hypothetical protein
MRALDVLCMWAVSDQLPRRQGMRRDLRIALGVIGALVLVVTFMSLFLQPALLNPPDGGGPRFRDIGLLIGVAMLGVAGFVQGVVVVADFVSERRISGAGSAIDKSTPVQQAIQRIQDDLYGTNDRLLGVLVSCRELSDLASLPGDYSEWLNLELTGYPTAVPDERVEWMNKWGSHRLVPGYVEVWNRDPQTRRLMTVQLSTNPLFFRQPLGEILRILDKALSSDNARFETPLAGYEAGFVHELELSLAQAGFALRVLPDAKLYFGSVALQRILDGVRIRVVWLVDEVRGQPGSSLKG